MAGNNARSSGAPADGGLEERVRKRARFPSENAKTVLRVGRDGVGFEPSEVGPHAHRNGDVGLFSTRERLNHLGGRIELRSKPGRGTVVTLAAPLEKPSP